VVIGILKEEQTAKEEETSECNETLITGQ